MIQQESGLRWMISCQLGMQLDDECAVDPSQLHL